VRCRRARRWCKLALHDQQTDRTALRIDSLGGSGSDTDCNRDRDLTRRQCGKREPRRRCRALPAQGCCKMPVTVAAAGWLPLSRVPLWQAPGGVHPGPLNCTSQLISELRDFCGRGDVQLSGSSPVSLRLNPRSP
jgi:hypothetical protein